MEESLKVQIGGDHYKRFSYQPVEFITKLGLGFVQGNIIKYVTRYPEKEGTLSIAKAIHYAEIAKDLKIKVTNIYTDGEMSRFILDNDLEENVAHIVMAAVKGYWDDVIVKCKEILEEYAR